MSTTAAEKEMMEAHEAIDQRKAMLNSFGEKEDQGEFIYPPEHTFTTAEARATIESCAGLLASEALRSFSEYEIISSALIVLGLLNEAESCLSRMELLVPEAFEAPQITKSPDGTFNARRRETEDDRIVVVHRDGFASPVEALKWIDGQTFVAPSGVPTDADASWNGALEWAAGRLEDFADSSLDTQSFAKNMADSIRSQKKPWTGGSHA